MRAPALLALALSAVVLLLRVDGHGVPQAAAIAPAPSAALERARANGVQFEQAVAATRRLLHAWLAHADPRTTLLPDRLDADRSTWLYTPHNSGADLYPYLVLTAQLTDPDLYEGRMLEMLRNEIRFTSAQASVPGNLTFATGETRATEPLWRRRVREGRPRQRHRVPGPHAVVLSHGRPDGRRDGAGARDDALRQAARVGHRAQRRLPADADASGRR